MKKQISLIGIFCSLLVGCVHPHEPVATKSPAVETVRNECVPDRHLGLLDVTVVPEKKSWLAKGETDSAETKKALIKELEKTRPVIDEIVVLPTSKMGNKVWGIATISVANMRENPAPSAELGTQVLMGGVVKVLKQQRGWFLVQSQDRYLGWMEDDSFVLCTKAEADAWVAATNKWIVTAWEDRIRLTPDAKAFPVSDVVAGDFLKNIGNSNGWLRVELPDGRSGFLQSASAQNYAEWKASLKPTPETVETIARSMMGTPYLWGANSTKAMDCSGFARTVYMLNGVSLNRNASHQALQGTDIPIADDFSHLRKGDLIFFGQKARGDKKERVTHVAIYLGDKLFIHSSGMVKINSLDPKAPEFDEHRLMTLLRARRFLN